MRDAETRTDAMRAAIAAYRKRKITHEHLARELRELDIEPAKIDQILQAERLVYPEDIYQTPQEEVRAYGRGTVIRRYKEGLIDDADFRQEMALLGYTAVLIEQTLVLARLERDFDYCMDRLHAAHEAYAVGVLDDTTFPQELVTFMVDGRKIKLEHEKAMYRKLPKVKRK